MQQYTYIDVIFLGPLFSFIGSVISIITRKTRKIHPALWISGIISCMLGYLDEITGEYATPEGYLIDIVEDQPTEEANEDTVDNEVQEDFSEESEEENPESSLENEDYPGEDVVEIINLQGETTTVYKLVDGRYMDCTNTVYIYDGKDTWTDTNGVEWNREVK